MNYLSLETPGSYKLLSDPGIWTADTEVTSHNTPHNVGIIEQIKGGSGDSVAVENVHKVEPRKEGSITGIITDKK